MDPELETQGIDPNPGVGSRRIFPMKSPVLQRRGHQALREMEIEATEVVTRTNLTRKEGYHDAVNGTAEKKPLSYL